MYGALVKISNTGGLAVTLDEAKLNCRITSSAEDSLVTELINAAILWVENYLERTLTTTIYDYYLDAPLPGRVIIPLGKPQSVDGVAYIATGDDTETIWPEANYYVDVRSDIDPYIVPKESWPDVDQARPKSFRIRFETGYGTAAQVPAPIKRAINAMVAHWYTNREAVTVGTISSTVQKTVEGLLWNYKIHAR